MSVENQMTPQTMTLQLSPERAALVRMLSIVYRSVNWAEQGGKSVMDRWESQLRGASIKGGTLGELGSRLCAALGVQSVRDSEAFIAALAFCEPSSDELLDWVRRETFVVATWAHVVARGKVSL